VSFLRHSFFFDAIFLARSSMNGAGVNLTTSLTATLATTLNTALSLRSEAGILTSAQTRYLP
jgi:hypothetical protein